MLQCQEPQGTIVGADAKVDWRISLQRSCWAWEFLRRNPQYQKGAQTRAASPGAWGLLEYAEPTLDARVADVFWHPNSCTNVLPLFGRAVPRASDATVRVNAFSPEVSIRELRQQGGLHVLFRTGVRSLQLSITGGETLAYMQLLTPIAVNSQPSAQIVLIRRLMSLLANRTLVPALYRGDRRGPRLLRVLQALDGALAGCSHRDIAVTLFGQAHVAREWASPGRHLRDQVRRAIRYGQTMMNGGYRGLLL